MILPPHLLLLLQVFPDPPPPPQPPPPPTAMACVNIDTIVNSLTVNTCVPGLRVTGYGSAAAPERRDDGTWMHRIPYRADGPRAFETTICGIDLIDFTFRSDAGATLNTSESADPARYCITKGFTVRPGQLTLEVRTRTEFPNLRIRSSVMPGPIATILQQPSVSTFVIVPPVVLFVPPPPPVLPPPSAPPPPPF